MSFIPNPQMSDCAGNPLSLHPPSSNASITGSPASIPANCSVINPSLHHPDWTSPATALFANWSGTHWHLPLVVHPVKLPSCWKHPPPMKFSGSQNPALCSHIDSASHWVALSELHSPPHQPPWGENWSVVQLQKASALHPVALP